MRTPQSSKMIVYLTISGKEDRIVNKLPVLDTEDDNAKLAYAKVVSIKDKVHFYIKKNHKGDLYNPSLTNDAHENKQQTSHGKHKWNFVKVSQEQFQLYTKFLKTKNVRYLNQANRKIT